jgi:hypothetical protein
MFANWLNTAFAGLDGGMFNLVHNLANKCGGFLTPILKYTAASFMVRVYFSLIGISFMCHAPFVLYLPTPKSRPLLQ